MALTNDELEPIKRIARTRDALRDAFRAAEAQSRAALAAFRDAQATARAASNAYERAAYARDLLGRIAMNDRALDETAVCRAALEWAPEVAPDLVGTLTAALTAREGAMKKADPAHTALEAAVEALLA